MVNPRLAKQWGLTETLLRDATVLLGGEAIPEFEKYLAHNELGLAFDVLVEEGERRSGSGAFWRKLKQAADQMGLNEHRNDLRRRVREAEEKERNNAIKRT